jgi:hypothetical protein
MLTAPLAGMSQVQDTLVLHDFKEYLSKFKRVAAPFDSSKQDTTALPKKPGTVTPTVTKKFITQFLGEDTVNFEKFVYRYGYIFELTPDFITVLAIKLNYGKNDFEDYFEDYLVVYTPDGKLLSKQNIGMVNDNYYIAHIIDSAKVITKQIINDYSKELDDDTYRCDVGISEHSVDKDGNIIGRAVAKKSGRILFISNKYGSTFELIMDE